MSINDFTSQHRNMRKMDKFMFGIPNPQLKLRLSNVNANNMQLDTCGGVLRQLWMIPHR